MSAYGYKAGNKLIRTRFVWIWEDQTVTLPDNFDTLYQEYCEKFELDLDDDDSMDMFIGDSLDDWGGSWWAETDRDTQDQTWELAE